MKNARILFCHDSEDILLSVASPLKGAGTELIPVQNPARIYDFCMSLSPHMVILAYNDSFRNISELIGKINTRAFIPILVLSGSGGHEDEVRLLNSGADEYIRLPVHNDVIIARIRSLLRRTLKYQSGSVLVFPDLEIDRETFSVTYRGENIPLTVKELELLYCLAAHPGRVFDREQLLSGVWGYDYVGSARVVDTMVKRLRRKFGQSGYWQITTVYGAGYKFELI